MIHSGILARAIGILSGKGGVGKTTLVSNIGIALAKEFSENVVIVDSNISTSHLGLHLGLYDEFPYTLADVLNQKVPVSNAVYIHPTGVRILPAPLSLENVKITKLNKVVNQLKKIYDIAVVDFAPGLGKEFMSAIYSIDDVVIVVNPDFPSVSDAIRTIQVCKKLNKNVLGIVVNRWKNEKYELLTKEIEAACGVGILAVIPEDRRIPESISKGLPAVVSYPNSSASVEIKKLSGSLVGKNYKHRNLFGSLMNWFANKHLSVKNFRKAKEQSKPMVHEVDVKEMKRNLTPKLREELKKEIIEKVRRKLEAR